MTHEQFIAKLVEMGYKEKANRQNYHNFGKRNKSITIQEWDDYTNLFYDKDTVNGTYEYNQFSITDYAQALRNITKFERKLGI